MKKQIVTNAMMTAYMAMRGPDMGSKEQYGDPLFRWISQREDQPQVETVSATGQDRRRPKDILNMIAAVDQSLLGRDGEVLVASPSRHALFDVDVPPTHEHQHFRPPPNMDLATHSLTANSTGFSLTQGENNDDDDDEAGQSTGRISPCTFLAWSEGARRWDMDKLKTELQNTQRLRPTSPRTPKQRQPGHYLTSGEVRPLFDQETGEQLTPQYPVPTSPSLIFTPPGVPETAAGNSVFGSTRARTADGHDVFIFGVEPDFYQKYSRMDPLAARELKRAHYGEPGYEVEFTVAESGDERYGHSEVERAVNYSLPTTKFPQGPCPELTKPVLNVNNHTRRPTQHFEHDGDDAMLLNHVSDNDNENISAAEPSLQKQCHHPHHHDLKAHLHSQWATAAHHVSLATSFDAAAAAIHDTVIPSLREQLRELRDDLLPRLQWRRQVAVHQAAHDAAVAEYEERERQHQRQRCGAEGESQTARAQATAEEAVAGSQARSQKQQQQQQQRSPSSSSYYSPYSSSPHSLARKQEKQQEQRKQQRIRGHIAAHALDARAALDVAALRAEHAGRKLAAREGEAEQLQMQIDGLCLSMGKSGVGEVREELGFLEEGVDMLGQTGSVASAAAYRDVVGFESQYDMDNLYGNYAYKGSPEEGTADVMTVAESLDDSLRDDLLALAMDFGTVGHHHHHHHQLHQQQAHYDFVPEQGQEWPEILASSVCGDSPTTAIIVGSDRAEGKPTPRDELWRSDEEETDQLFDYVSPSGQRIVWHRHPPVPLAASVDDDDNGSHDEAESQNREDVLAPIPMPPSVIHRVVVAEGTTITPPPRWVVFLRDEKGGENYDDEDGSAEQDVDESRGRECGDLYDADGFLLDDNDDYNATVDNDNDDAEFRSPVVSHSLPLQHDSGDRMEESCTADTGAGSGVSHASFPAVSQNGHLYYPPTAPTTTNTTNTTTTTTPPPVDLPAASVAASQETTANTAAATAHISRNRGGEHHRQITTVLREENCDEDNHNENEGDDRKRSRSNDEEESRPPFASDEEDKDDDEGEGEEELISLLARYDQYVARYPYDYDKDGGGWVLTSSCHDDAVNADVDADVHAIGDISTSLNTLVGYSTTQNNQDDDEHGNHISNNSTSTSGRNSKSFPERRLRHLLGRLH